MSVDMVGGDPIIRGSVRDITKSKQAEEELRQREEQLRIVAENVPGVLQRFDRQLRVVWLSPAAEKVHGISVEKFIGKTNREMGMPEHLCELWETAMNEVLKTGQPRTVEFGFDSVDGPKTFLLRLAPEFGADGKAEFILGIATDITERKRAEEALLESEEISRQRLAEIEDLYRNAPVGLCMFDRKLHYIRINERLAEINGISAVAHIGKSVRDVLPQLADEVEPEMLHVLETGQPRLNIELVGETLSQPGVKRSWLEQWLPMTDAQGQVTGLNIVVEETTERKRAEEALRKSEELFRKIFENAAIGIAIGDLGGRVISSNLAFENMLGYSKDELRGKHFSEFTCSDDVSKEKLLIEELLSGHRDHYDIEKLYIRKDGQVINVQLKGGFIGDKNGKPIAGVALIEDITGRKRAEEALKNALDTLEEKVKERTAELEEAYNSLLENELRLNEAQKIAHLGNWDWNLRTDKTHWSDEIYRIFGLKRMEFDGSYDAFLSCVDPEDRSYVHNAFQKALNGELYNIEYRITLPDGGKRIAHSQGEVVFDEKHTPIRMRGVLQDITERKKTEEALEKIDKIRIKEIHHRIKNNLQVISSLLDLQSETFDDDMVKEAFKQSQDRVISMALIHEELYKGEGTDKLNFSAYLQKLAESLFQTYNFCGKNIHLCMNLEDNAFLEMDTAVPLGIIVNELISNSLKHAFTEKQEGEIRIQLCREEQNNEMHNSLFSLTVSDNGKGISEDLELESVESLGMQLVSILVDQLDGQIELKRDHGAELRITFRNG